MRGYGGGYGLWTDGILGYKNLDLALIYTALILIIQLFEGRLSLPKGRFFFFYTLTILAFLCCFAFSHFHYNFTYTQIIQGGRSFWLFLSLPIFMQMKITEMQKLFTLLLLVTMLTSVLYILQIVLRQPLMHYGMGYRFDSSTGLIRLYNSPAFLVFFLCLSFAAPKYFGKHQLLAQVILFLALLCTLGRNRIFTGVITIGLTLIFIGKATRLIKTIIVICIIAIPLSDFIVSRFEKGGETQNDLEAIISGKYKDNYQGEGGTMTYRLAWIYERAHYLEDRPFSEKMLGLGIISDSQPIVHLMYHFRTGIWKKELNDVTQLTTADISYGNLLSRLGYLGSGIYLAFVLCMTFFFYKRRKFNIFFSVCAAQCIMIFFTGITGSSLSEPKNFVLFFMGIAFYYNYSSRQTLIANHPTNHFLLPLNK